MRLFKFHVHINFHKKNKLFYKTQERKKEAFEYGILIIFHLILFCISKNKLFYKTQERKKEAFEYGRLANFYLIINFDK